jgi:MFS family permease
MDYIRFFFDNKRLISFGFLLTFFSSFGQTFLLSLYVPIIIEDFGLTHSFFGGVYALATVGSSFILVYAGKQIDKSDLKKYTLYSAFLLMLSCLILAFSVNILMVFLGILGLRFAGQGLLSHISNTTISKNFDKSRGKALSITSLGYASGEGFFPMLVSFVIGYAGWRNSLITNSVAVGILLIPAAWFSLKEIEGHSQSHNQRSTDNYSRRFLLKDKFFFLLAVNSVVLPFLVTGLFFYQSSLAEFKNWPIEWLTFCFIGFAIGRSVFSLLSGKLIDKFSAVRLLPGYLLPFLVGLILLLLVEHVYSGLIYLLLTGVSVGLAGTIKTAAIAEIYGPNQLGGIRSVFAMLMVLGTALSPLLFGSLIDMGLDFSYIILFAVALVILISLFSMSFNAKPNYNS